MKINKKKQGNALTLPCKEFKNHPCISVQGNFKSKTIQKYEKKQLYPLGMENS